MKRILTIIALSTLSIVTLIACGKKQKVIFEGESIEFKNKHSLSQNEIQEECGKLSESLNDHIESGWKVIASSPKEKVVYYDRGRCIGTEYILEK